MTTSLREAPFADRACETARARLHCKLLEFLGVQPGLALGSDAARTLLHSFKPWLYDRTTGLLLDVRLAHPSVAGLLYCLHQGKDPAHGEGELFLASHMGFWLSSCSVSTRRVHVSAGLRLTAQERMAFRTFTFVQM